jgi:hypothetical protein
MDALSSPDILLFGPFRFDRRGMLLFRYAEVIANLSASAPVRSQCSPRSPNDLAIS